MKPPTYLVRSGWKSTTLKPGDKISVTVNPIRSGEPRGIFVSVALPDERSVAARQANPLVRRRRPRRRADHGVRALRGWCGSRRRGPDDRRRGGLARL
jgi:hypothetical protein